MYKNTLLMKENTKEQRRRILAEVVSRSGPGDQIHLLNELRARGIEVTQATVSRDLQEMGYVKIRLQPHVYRYEKLEPSAPGGLWERLGVLFLNFVSAVRGTGNLLLVKTSPGNANGVASLLDGLQRPEILGTVAGDDTILVVVETEAARRVLEEELRGLL